MYTVQLGGRDRRCEAWNSKRQEALALLVRNDRVARSRERYAPSDARGAYRMIQRATADAVIDVPTPSRMDELALCLRIYWTVD